MKKSFQLFLSKVHHYPEPLLEVHLKSLLEDADIASLRRLELFKRSSDLKELPCPNCDNNHFVPIKIEDKKPYYLCPYEDAERNYIAPEEIATWTFDVEAFLRQLSSKLKIDDNIEKTKVEGLWEIGGLSKDDTRHNCFFYHGRDFKEALVFIKRLPHSLRRYVIFTCKQETETLESQHEMLTIEIKEIIGLKNKKLSFNLKHFDNHITHGFRRVIFTPENGQLIVNGAIATSVKPSTPEYYFLQILWENFNQPVSHQAIRQRIYEKTGKEYEDDAQKVAHKQKLKVQQGANDTEIIDTIIQSTKDVDGENAYILVSP